MTEQGADDADRRGPDLFEVALNQRAHRELLADPVPEEDIERILAAAVCAPNAQNVQPWEFVVVTDRQVLAAVAEATKKAWEGFARDFVEGVVDDAQFNGTDRWATGGLAEVPVLVVVCVDTSKMPLEMAGSSVFPAAQNILLAAGALGYGSLMANLPTYAGEEFRTALGLPEHIEAVATIPIGRPARALGPPRRDPFTAHTHRDRYSTPW